jgi:hypothetical protein
LIERKFLSAVPDEKVRENLQHMLDDDQKNLGILDTVIVQYGVRADTPETFSKLGQKPDELMSGSQLSLVEKLFPHKLLKPSRLSRKLHR